MRLLNSYLTREPAMKFLDHFSTPTRTVSGVVERIALCFGRDENNA